MVAVVWQFTTHQNTGDEFERFYGADGEWTKLSRRSRSFLDSSFLKDVVVRSQAAYTDNGFQSEARPMPDALVGTVAAVPGVDVAEGSVTGFALRRWSRR